MYEVAYSSRFNRDVKTCAKRHWDMDSFRQALTDLINSDQVDLALHYKDHPLDGQLKGYRSIHVNSHPNPPRERWVLTYRVAGDVIFLHRTGTHDEIYGR